MTDTTEGGAAPAGKHAARSRPGGAGYPRLALIALPVSVREQLRATSRVRAFLAH